jgi:hypothetical protein
MLPLVVKCVVVCMNKSSLSHLKVGLLYSSARILVVLQLVPSTWDGLRGCIHWNLLLNKGLLVVRRLSSVYLGGRLLACLASGYLVRGVA